MSTELSDGDSRGKGFTHDGSQKDETNCACTHTNPLTQEAVFRALRM